MAEAIISTFLHGNLPTGAAEVLTRLRRTPAISHIALMPDLHLSGEFCVGMVVASPTHLFPHAVGGDIGCGMLALRCLGTPDALADPATAARLLGDLSTLCPGRRHHRRTGHTLSPALKNLPLSHPLLASQRSSDASTLQLGTLGAGNHFLELQRDTATNHLWLMLHTGSRHLGQLIFHHHLPFTHRTDTGLLAIEADTPAGKNYLLDVAAARAWAAENRRLLALRAADAIDRLLRLSPDLPSLLDCDHNHVQQETHNHQPMWIHRKGATPAHAGLPGIIPGSMGTFSFHTTGRGHAPALCSSSHGSGRALSRTQAKSTITISRLRQQLRGVWYDARLESSLREEAPAAYKPIEDVMAAQADLTAITRRLRPILVHKGA